MTHYHQLLEPYRRKLRENATKEEIAWAYLEGLKNLDEEIGIYYIFEPKKVDDSLCLSIVSLLSRLKLAQKTTHELGNKNYYMKIKDEGIFAIENFNSIKEYEGYLTEKQKDKSGNIIYGGNNIIGSNISDSKINQGYDFRDFNIENTPIMPPSKYDNKQNTITSSILNVIKNFVLPLIIGVILLYIEHKTHFFSEKLSPK